MTRMTRIERAYRRAANSRAFREGYEDARSGRAPNWDRWDSLYEYGRLTAVYSYGDGGNAIPVAVHGKLAPHVLTTIAEQYAQLIAATSANVFERDLARIVITRTRTLA